MFDEKSYNLKMDKAIEVFLKELSSLRTGRANAAMLDLVKVDVYGQQMPLNQLATVSVPEARLISIQVWDKANITLIESALQKSELGINPQIDGQIIRLRIPDHKRKSVQYLQKLNFEVVAAGDSYNDLGMLKTADYCMLFNPPEQLVQEYPDIKVGRDYPSLLSFIESPDS